MTSRARAAARGRSLSGGDPARRRAPRHTRFARRWRRGLGLPTRPSECVLRRGHRRSGASRTRGRRVRRVGRTVARCWSSARRPGGQAGTSSRIENYLGFPTGVSGDELGDARAAAGPPLRRGAPGRACVVGLGSPRSAGIMRSCWTVATRADAHDDSRDRRSWRELDVPGADALVGRGIYYGAARTEAQGCQGQRVFLIGGGNSAGQAAMFFAGLCERGLAAGARPVAGRQHVALPDRAARHQEQHRDVHAIAASCRSRASIG